MALLTYQRASAVQYARRWALGRNPRYPDFTGMGGDCANFISQCLIAGGGRMNLVRDIGWYYRSMNDRAPAWSGVMFLHRFLLRAQGEGPVARRMERARQLRPGDVIFLADGTRIYHSLIVLEAGDDPLIAAHTVDSLMRPLSSYEDAGRIFIRIEGVNSAQ